jgi:hypothetical protein
MSRSYTIQRALEFDVNTGYWQVSVAVTDASNLNPRPFLMEKAVLGVPGENTLAASNEEAHYIRTILDGESSITRLETDTTQYSSFTWLRYRAASFTKSYYTYDQASSALQATLAALRSNAQVYQSTVIAPRIVAINLSSEEKKPRLSSIQAKKGDTLSLQLINGPHEVEPISDADLIELPESYPRIDPAASARIVTIGSDEGTFIGLADFNTGDEYHIELQLVPTPNEGTVTEVIK